jgi:hypothetical protein
LEGEAEVKRDAVQEELLETMRKILRRIEAK